jgi:alpha-tubulin suppressor-like RCC1 family protein
VLAAALGSALVGCGTDRATAPAVPAALWVTTEVDTIAAGDSAVLVARATDESGGPVDAGALRWSSSDPSVATVDSVNGHVAALAPGSVMISASLRGVRGYAELVVTGRREFSAVAQGWVNSCAISTDGRAFCTGWNGYGELGIDLWGYDATFGDRSTRAVRTLGEQRLRSISSVGLHTCGLTTRGVVYCWGLGRDEQLGVDKQGSCQADPLENVWTPCLAHPGRVTMDNFVAVTVGLNSTCALRADGHPFCWGNNDRGQLGSATYIRWGLPLPVEGDFLFATIAGGRDHFCATTADQRAFCWGSNWRGQLGTDAVVTCFDGERDCYGRRPYAVLGGHAFASVAPGGFHSCGLTTTQEVYCWGDNSLGQLGDGTGVGTVLPQRVGTARYVAVSSGYLHSCALDASGRAWCWGLNDDGELGAPSAETCLDAENAYPCSLAPVAAQPALRFRSITAGTFATCGITVQRDIKCWGWNDYGQLGNGTLTGGLVATTMSFAPALASPTPSPVAPSIPPGAPGLRHRLRADPSWRALPSRARHAR